MTPTAAPDAVSPATPELVALAVAVRRGDPLWREDYVYGVITQAMQEAPPMTWEQILTGLSRLMVDPAAEPRDLIPDSRSPLAHRTVLPRERTEQLADVVWAEMETAVQAKRGADEAAEAAARAGRARERGVA